MKNHTSKVFTVLLISISTLAFANDVTINNFDGARIIKAGTHTAAENKSHQEFCKKYNAIDVTDLSDIKLASNSTDGVICFSSGPSDFTAMAGEVTPAATSLTTTVPSVTLGFMPYFIEGTASYTGANIGSGLAMQVSVPADNCGLIGGSAINMSTGIGRIKVTCSYPSSKGARQSIMQASLEGRNSTAYGTIILK